MTRYISKLIILKFDSNYRENCNNNTNNNNTSSGLYPYFTLSWATSAAPRGVPWTECFPADKLPSPMVVLTYYYFRIYYIIRLEDIIKLKLGIKNDK